jgi:hypothetical protein
VNIRSRIYELLIKLSGSRKSFFSLLAKLETYLAIGLIIFDVIPSKNMLPFLVLFALNDMVTMSYLGIIEYEKVKLEASIRK